MATMSRPVATVSIPRFLLPQLTWKAPHLRPAATLQPSRRRQRRPQHLREPHSQQRSLTTQTVDWSALAKHVEPPGAQSKLTRSLYRALRVSLQPNSSPNRPSSSLLSPLSPIASSFTNRHFSTSRPFGRDHHFDTLKFVQRLKDEGFSETQAAAMMRVLSDVIEESIQNLTRTMVLREDAERATYTQKVDFTKLRSELLSSDNAEASLTRASHERLANDLTKINNRLRDEIGRTQASVRLDLNLEKGRIREEANVQELKIKETEARIEQEVAGLRERVEGVKFSTLQWLMGVCTGTAAILLGAWRLLM